MPTPLQQNFIMQPAAKPGAELSGSATHTSITNIPAEAYQSVDKIIDPEAMFANKFSRLLFKAYLVKTDMIDEHSPIPGYKLVGIGKPINPDHIDEDRGTLVNWDGYNTIMSNFVLLVSEAISTTEFDVKELNLKKVCIDGVWAIVVQIVTNWEDWNFKDPSEIMPLGIAMWFNLYSVARRSTGGKMLTFFTGLLKVLGPQRASEAETENKVMFWRSHATPR